MSKRVKNILVMVLFIVPFVILIKLNISFPCIFKTLTGISCPACGMTRAIYSIIKLDFLAAIKYNILSIPFAMFVISSIIFLIRDLVKNDDKYLKRLIHFLEKYYILIIFILFVSMIYNIYTNK